MWNLKKTLLMNIFINTNQKQTHRHRKSLWLPKRKGWKRGKQDYEINRYTGYTLYKINNKGLLHSTENYIQYLVITYSGKESEKNICITDTYISVHIQTLYVYIYTYKNILIPETSTIL